jgi:hypothetical protein
MCKLMFVQAPLGLGSALGSLHLIGGGVHTYTLVRSHASALCNLFDSGPKHSHTVSHSFHTCTLTLFPLTQEVESDVAGAGGAVMAGSMGGQHAIAAAEAACRAAAERAAVTGELGGHSPSAGGAAQVSVCVCWGGGAQRGCPYRR